MELSQKNFLIFSLVHPASANDLAIVDGKTTIPGGDTGPSKDTAGDVTGGSSGQAEGDGGCSMGGSANLPVVGLLLGLLALLAVWKRQDPW